MTFGRRESIQENFKCIKYNISKLNILVIKNKLVKSKQNFRREEKRYNLVTY